jgi:hypothetical protein
MPMWNFSFSHPLGGYGRIDISCNERGVYLMKWWVFDDFDGNKRFVRQDKAGQIEGVDNQLEATMLQAIKEVLGWSPKSLKSLGSIGRGPWSDLAKRHKYPMVEF